MATATQADEDVTRLAPGEAKLLPVLRQRIAASLLPGEAALPRDVLDDAGKFLLEAARLRPEGKGSVLVRSAPGARVTRIAVVNKDMPFLVDSVSATVAAQGLAIDLLVHPIMPVTRDAKGK